MPNTDPPGLSRLAILADDLTGALDSAAAFIADDGEGPPFVALTPGAVVPERCGAVSVNADSRRLPVSGASDSVRKALEGTAASGKNLRYVKIDSTLRGHPGLEIEQCALASSASLVIFSPAFPATGRTVVGGELLVHGEPLAQTDVGRDPLSPLESSNVAEIVRRATKVPVREINLNDVRGEGLSAEFAKLAAEPGQPPVIACCDAETDEDLDLLIAAGLSVEADSGRRVLFAGSAGLAFALSRAGRDESRRSASQPDIQFTKPVLVVTASQRRLADRQIANLVAEHLADLSPVEFVIDESNGVTGPDNPPALTNDRNIVLHATITGDLAALAPEAVRNIADQVTQQLGRLVASLVTQHRIGGLVIIGGDTARDALLSIDARGIVLAAEPLPGVPVGTIIGGALDGVPIATKAGAFGDDQTLVHLFKHMRPDGNNS